MVCCVALMGDHQKAAASFGWKNTMTAAAGNHDWAAMRSNVQDHIKGNKQPTSLLEIF